MRALSLFSALVFFLLLGSYAAFSHEHTAEVSTVTTIQFKGNPISKFTSDSQHLTLIEDLDSAQEEEIHHDADSKIIDKSDYLGRCLPVTIFHRDFAAAITAYTYGKNQSPTSGLFGNSCPVYLAHRVLRI